MIEEHFLLSCIFPWILFDRDGRAVSSNDGTLFGRPSEILEASYIDLGPTLRVGWSCCPKGYAVYANAVPAMPGHTLMLYGLKVAGISTAKGKNETLSLRCNRSDIENYVGSLINTANVIDQTFISLTRSNIHEVRSINKQIYSHSDSIRHYFDTTPNLDKKQHESIRSVVKLSDALRTRSDFLDVIANPELSEANQSKIPVYRNFDMVRKALMRAAEEKCIDMSISGSSTGKILGFGHFHQIPYQLIDNAIKYSPEEQSIQIHISEDDSQIFARVTSVGPLIEKSEETKIFSFSYRGINAARFTEGGTGVGLYFLKHLVENKHGGRVTFYQETQKATSFRSVQCCPTHFHLRFPRAE